MSYPLFGLLLVLAPLNSFAQEAAPRREAQEVKEIKAADILADLPAAEQDEIKKDLELNGIHPRDLDSVTFAAKEKGPVVISVKSKQSIGQMIYLGLRLGAPHVVGGRAVFLKEKQGKLNFQIDVELATS